MTTSAPFSFPPHHSFPPFFTRQPTQTTHHAQLQKWSSLILSYCQHHRLFKLSLSTALELDLFKNDKINRRLGREDAKEVVEFMVRGGGADWVGGKGKAAGEVFWVWWRTVEEWGERVYGWVDATAQKNMVLTLYELTESDATVSEDFHGMDPDLLQRVLNGLVKRGKAQIFGQDPTQGLGVKFF